ncbi:flavin-containing monooxygenase [Streptomyces sp. NBC_00525]|uniref:flavin-containing monooxygenase n=1 Tax=Streptomyces sp. NBC_00525 TaxID=2903660 RepID=UPI002E8142A5|nr:NAD(P)/FAD-dependent oxidoreductase [Streptomyces sp. NBC_00525]WUC95259.1 NAD(P)/FAD-dependent oxidoreductase [Streptomyces sp. NBC_00525]
MADDSIGQHYEAEVVVIGAGISGLAAVIALREAGFDDVVVLEKSARLGGTWRDNTYPGCGCDVPAMLYEYTFAPHTWSRGFAGRPEILDYLDNTATAHGVHDAIRYDTEVLEARWEPAAHRWRLRTTSGTCAARAVIVATGPWHRPRIPDIPGLDTFPGAAFHSARWDHGVDLAGQRVAVVGTGASTVQFLPEIQPRAARVDVFQSTPQWVLPKPDYPLPPGLHRYFARHPAARRALRGLHHLTQESIGFPLRHPSLLRPLETLARLHLRTSVRDRALRRALTPDYRLGGRRLITSSTYYAALTRPNVRLRPTRVTAVDGSDVIGADGSRTRADVLVLATGFHIGDIPLAPHLHGTEGTLAESWAGSRRAYLGTSVSGYPNLFLLIGPNLLTGTTAVPTVLEAQLRYVTDALSRLRAGGASATLDVRPGAEAAYQRALHEALSGTVYNAGGGTGYYFGLPGVNTFCWPWSTARLVKRLHAFDPDDYTWQLSLPAQADAAHDALPAQPSDRLR